LKTIRQRIADACMDHRAAVLALLVAITIGFGMGLPRVELRTIFSDLLPANHPFVQTWKDHPNFGNPLTVTVMVKRTDGDIYNAETLAKIWNMTRDIDLTPAVDHDQIVSIATEKARYQEATPFGVDSQPLMGDHPPATEDEIAEFRRRVEKSPASRTFLISADGTATLIRATFIERLLDYGESFEHVQALVERERDAHHEVHVAGQPMLTGWVYRYEYQMLGIFAITGGALLVALVLYMRNVAGVVAPLLTSLTAGVWGFGLVGWIGHPVEPLIMVVPLLLMARSFSHCVQVIERYYEIYHAVQGKRKAARIVMGVMMAPGTLGIVTDAAGLFLIAVAPIPVMERFALFCGFWALSLIPTNVILTPILLTLLPKPDNIEALIGHGQSQSRFHAGVRRFLQGVARLSYGRRGRITTAVVAAVAVAGFVRLLDMQVGNPVEGSNLLWEDSEYNVAVAHINSHFPGLNTLEIVFESKAKSNERRLMHQADTVQAMFALQRRVESEEVPPVATLSWADYLPEANRLFSGGNPKWAPLDPADEAVAAAAGAVLFGSSPKAFLNVTDFVQENGTVSLWYKDNRQETVDRAIAQARRAVEAVGTDHEAFRIRLAAGTIALQQSINDTVDDYQYIIMTLLNVVMLLTCAWAYRSFVAGFLLLIPVNLSNVLLGAVMVSMGIGLDVNTLPITAIGIGVGIDYGIYLLSRICEEYQLHDSFEKSIFEAVGTTGKAIFFTASIVLIGILPWYFLSELKFLADMGLLLVMVMLINMVIALIVLPLLVWLIKPRFTGSKDLLVGEGVDLAAYAT
jgi:hypothetical protein